MKDKDNFMIEGKEMMSCCLTKDTHQTAPRLALDEERNCRVGGRRTKYSENYKAVIEALARHDQMDRTVLNASSFDQMDRRWKHATTVPAGIWAV